MQNIGLDWSGVHTGPMPQYHHKKLAEQIKLERIEFKESITARKAMAAFYSKNYGDKKLLNKLKSYFFK